MDEMREALNALLPKLSIAPTEAQTDTLCRFGSAVLEQNKVMNLTAITDPAAFARLHLADSLTLLRCADFDGKSVIDVGCGAGFPGVPLAICRPDARVTLLDSLAKRTTWLERTLPMLGVRAEVATARAEEEAAARRESYDIAVSRAVARLNVLLELLTPYVRVGGTVLAMKGERAKEELDAAANAVKRLGLQFVEARPFPAIDTAHTVLIFRKTAQTPPTYPRRYAKIVKAPL